MSEPKFTKGPWNTICTEGSCECGLVFGEGGTVFIANAYGPRDVEQCDPVPGREEQIGNQHLIAAAPDLYAALGECLDALNNFGMLYADRLFEQVLAALAKARGEVSDA
jgi:hypothetical protein